MEDSFSIKEMITEFRNDVKEEFLEVKAKQDHTNGDVTMLKIWRGYLTGAIGVIIILVIPLVVYVWNQAEKVQSKLTSIENYKQTYVAE